MSIVGEFPGLNSLKRRTIRGPINPMDRATIVSIWPKDVNERKVTLTPGDFFIPAGTFEKPTVLVVGPSSWWREIDEDQPLLEIPVSSIQIADSVVKDYCNGYFGCNMADSMPGLFYVPGENTVENIQKNYKTELERAKQRQHNLWSTLVKLGDALWARSNGNPLAVSDDMRLAARELNMGATRDWMRDFKMVNMIRCFACGNLKNPEYPVCPSCRAIDQNHAKAKEIKFA